MKNCIVSSFLVLTVIFSALSAHVFIPTAHSVTTKLEDDGWQLREMKYLGYPRVTFYTVNSTLMYTQVGSVGAGYVFSHFKRSDLNGKILQVKWNVRWAGTPDSRDLAFVRLCIFDKALNRTDMDNYFKEDLGYEPMFNLTSITEPHYPGPSGSLRVWFGWRVDSTGVLDLSSWTSDYVTVLLRTYNAWAISDAIGAFDWLRILDTSGTVLYFEAFNGNMTMEVAGTYHDYGRFDSYRREHDVAVSNLLFSRTLITQGSTITMWAYVQNLGEYDESFNATAYANDTVINTNFVTVLVLNGSSIAQFLWNTTALAKGYYNYTMSIVLTPVENETCTENNRLMMNMMFKVTIQGDVNGDRTVNVLDLIIMSRHCMHGGMCGYHPIGSSLWYECFACDLNGDNRVYVLDLIVCANHLGEHW